MSETNIAYIDIDLEELIPEYLENRKSDVIVIRELLQQNDLTEIRRLGHSMKGSGGGYGFDEISVIGRHIEDAALAGDLEVIKTQTQVLHKYIETVTIVWQEEE